MELRHKYTQSYTYHQANDGPLLPTIPQTSRQSFSKIAVMSSPVRKLKLPKTEWRRADSLPILTAKSYSSLVVLSPRGCPKRQESLPNLKLKFDRFIDFCAEVPLKSKDRERVVRKEFCLLKEQSSPKPRMSKQVVSRCHQMMQRLESSGA
jgi:hypothetical protein